MRRIITVLPVTVLLFCSLTSFSQSNDEETIKKLNRGFLDAIVNRDTAALSKILADDFVLINPSGIKRDKAANVASVLTPGQKVLSVDIDSAQVRMLSGDVGLITAWTNNIISAGGETTELKICYQDVYMKRKQGWQAVAAHVTVLNSRQVK